MYMISVYVISVLNLAVYPYRANRMCGLLTARNLYMTWEKK